MQTASIKSPLPFPTWQYNTDISVYKVILGEDGEEAKMVYDGPAIRKTSSDSKYSDSGKILRQTGLYVIRGEINNGRPFSGYLLEDDKRYEIAEVEYPEAFGKTYSSEVTTL